MKSKNRIKSFKKTYYIPILILSFFLICYLLLSVVKHYSYLSGYDLSVIDQAIWKYSRFKVPIATTHIYFDTPIYYDHLELIFLLIAPFYWIFNTVYVLITLQVFSVIASGIAIYLLSTKYKLVDFLKNCILVSYLSFFGIQFAVWSDVHSLVFGVCFLSFFLYFLDIKKFKLALLFLALTIISKEDMGLLTLLVSIVYFLKRRDKLSLICGFISLFYLFTVFFLFFPAILPGGYRFANSSGLLQGLDISNFINTTEKREAIFYSLGWFGFLPILSPLFLIPFIGDLFHYFVLGNIVVSSAQGLFMHYRSSVSLLLMWPTIISLHKFKRLNNKYIGLYLLFFALFFQYTLHLPLSYLTKKYFWAIPPEVKNINEILSFLPENASVATQNNIAVHIAHRDKVYTLFPDSSDFKTNSPCRLPTCHWFRVGGNPKFLLVDTGQTWNILQYLESREDFIAAIKNLENNGNIELIKQVNTSKLYKIVRKI